MAMTLKERLRTRLNGLKSNRRPYEQEAKEIASYGQPARSRWLTSDTNKSKRQRNRLNNSHGILAFRTLQGGMTSGLSSASRPWFSLGTHGDEMADDPETMTYLAAVQERMYSFLAQTNFYTSVKTGYLELGMFGTEACVMVEHALMGAVCHQLTFGEYWIGLGSALTSEALYRECPMTVVQAIERFGRSNLSKFINDCYDRSEYDTVLDFKHAIEINDEQDPFYKDSRGMRWRSAYWDEKDDTLNRLSDLRGYQEQPFWAPRWDTTGGDAWGTGPGHDALPDLRELQLQAKRKGEATDMYIWPELVAPSNLKLKRQPKSVVSAASVDKGQVYAAYEIEFAAIGEIRSDLDACKQAINSATYADLFMAITNMDGVQPRNIEEIAARNEEKLTQLGPVIERVNSEKLTIAIDRTFGIMERGGMLPPAPGSLRRTGGALKIDFISILAQMQRMVILGQIERTFQFTGTLAGLYPQVRYKLDPMKAMDIYARRAGLPAQILRSDDDANQDAQAEQQAQQQQQQAEMAAKMGPAAKAGAEAANTAANIPIPQVVNAQSLLASMPPGATPPTEVLTR